MKYEKLSVKGRAIRSYVTGGCYYIATGLPIWNDGAASLQRSTGTCYVIHMT